MVFVSNYSEDIKPKASDVFLQQIDSCSSALLDSPIR